MIYMAFSPRLIATVISDDKAGGGEQISGTANIKVRRCSDVSNFVNF